MKKGIAYVLGTALALLIACGPLSARITDRRTTTCRSPFSSEEGTVTEFSFINPHSAIHLEAKDDKGNIEQWLIEADSPNNLARAGWSRDSIKPGDQVTIIGNRVRDGSKVIRLQKIIFADGKELKPREGDEY